MKLTTTISIMLLSTLSAYSQLIVDGVNINEVKGLEFVQIVGKGKLFNDDINIKIDYGQQRSLFKPKKMNLQDKDGKKLNFQSIIHAMNFMNSNGWEYIDSHIITLEGFGGNQNVYHFLFKRK